MKARQHPAIVKRPCQLSIDVGNARGDADERRGATSNDYAPRAIDPAGGRNNGSGGQR